MAEYPVQVGDGASDADHEEAFASLNSVIITGSLLALIGIGYKINTHKLKHLPESCAAIALGFLVGCAVRVLQLTEEEALLNFRGTVFFYVLLPPIIFEAGLSLKAQLFVDNLGSILAFAVVGTLISTWVVSTSLQWAAELGMVGLENIQLLPVYCQLFGALISATDPVATIALFGSSRFKADPLLHSLINGESVLNDAVAIVLFGTLVHHSANEPRLISAPVLGQFCLVLLGSLAVGLGAGALLSWGFKTTQELARFPDYEISAMILGAYLTFALSQLFGLSGITALFFFGIVLAQYNWYNLSEPSKVASKVAFESIAKLCEACVFVYLGVVAALSIGRFHWHFGLVFFCMLSINLARAAHVFPLCYLLNLCRREKKISSNMSVVMWVSGLRGAIAFTLSLQLPCEGKHSSRGSDECRNSDLLITTTISIVLLTTLGVGTAMEKIATALHVIEPIDHYARYSGNHQLGTLSEPLAGPRGSSVESEDGRSPTQGSCDIVGPSRSGEDSPEMINGGRSARDFLRRSSSSLSSMSWARSLPRVRFQSRSQVYQDFARFDLSVLQPLFGGPCHARAEGARASIDSGGAMEVVDGADPSLELPCFQGEDEPPPLQSRAVIFE